MARRWPVFPRPGIVERHCNRRRPRRGNPVTRSSCSSATLSRRSRARGQVVSVRRVDSRPVDRPRPPAARLTPRQNAGSAGAEHRHCADDRQRRRRSRPVRDAGRGPGLYLRRRPPAWRDEFFYEHPTITSRDRIPSSQAVVPPASSRLKPEATRQTEGVIARVAR
jgi:hypothetical protein